MGASFCLIFKSISSKYMQKMEKHILTSAKSVVHPNAGWNLQQMYFKPEDQAARPWILT